MFKHFKSLKNKWNANIFKQKKKKRMRIFYLRDYKNQKQEKRDQYVCPNF